MAMPVPTPITPQSFQWIGGRYKLTEGEPVSLLRGDLTVTETYGKMKFQKMQETEERQRKFEEKKRRKVIDFLDKQGFDPVDLNAPGMETKTFCCGIGKRFYQTALHKAAKDQNVDMISLLLQFGADPKSKDSSGKTPFDYVKSSSWRTSLQILHTKIRTEGALSLLWVVQSAESWTMQQGGDEWTKVFMSYPWLSMAILPMSGSFSQSKQLKHWFIVADECRTHILHGVAWYWIFFLVKANGLQKMLSNRCLLMLCTSRKRMLSGFVYRWIKSLKPGSVDSQPLQTYSVHKVDPAPYAVESQFTRTTALRTSFLQHVGQVLMTWSNNSHQLGSAEAFWCGVCHAFSWFLQKWGGPSIYGHLNG